MWHSKLAVLLKIRKGRIGQKCLFLPSFLFMWNNLYIMMMQCVWNIHILWLIRYLSAAAWLLFILPESSIISSLWIKGRQRKTMKTRVRLERIIVIAGILVVLFLTLVTSSYYQNVLNQVEKDGGEDGNEYRYHYVMIVEDCDMPFWKDVYESTREAAREHNALVELMGKSLSSTIEIESLMDMAIASRVDGIILEYTGGHKIDERINEAGKAGIPVVTVLKDAPDTSRISFVGVNDYQLGRQYGEQILKLVPPDKDDVEVMLLLHDRDNSSQVQIAEQINNLLVTSPDTSGRVRLIQETMRSTGKDTSRISFVGVNDYQLGRQYGEQILKLVPPDKDDVEVMLLLHDRDNSSQVQIAEQINNLLVTSPDTSGRVRLIQETMRSTGKVDADETIRNIFFRKEGVPDVLVCTEAVDTEAAYQAMIDYNKVGELQLLGYYKSDQILEAVRKGNIPVTLVIDTEQMGRYCVQALEEYLQEGHANSYYSVDLQFVTKENVD